MLNSLARKRAFAVWWKDVDRWSVNSFRTSSWQWPPHVIMRLSSALERRCEPVKKKTFDLRPEHFVSLRFTGEIETRIKKDIALSEYILLVFRTAHFRRIINGMVSGTSGRKRVQPDDLENVEIPLPSLAEQKAIVARWSKAQNNISAMRQRIKHLEANLPKETRKALGIPERNEVTLPKAFAIQWAELGRWSFEYLARHVAGLSGNNTGKYPTHSLLSLCSGISGGTPSTKSPHYWAGNIPWVSPKDMKSTELFDSQDHISQAALDEAVPLVPANSVLIVVRSGILQRVVPIAVNRVPVSINQDLRAFVPRDARLSADFLASYLNCQQDALLRLVKWSTTVQSINKEELDGFEIPLPSPEEQKQIVERVKAGRAEIAREQEAAERLSKEIIADVEALILGSKTLGEQ